MKHPVYVLKIVHSPAILEIIYILLLLEFIIIQRSKKDIEVDKDYSKKTQESFQKYESGQSFLKKSIFGLVEKRNSNVSFAWTTLPCMLHFSQNFKP